MGFRKLMDFFPSVFSQNDLFWLDNLMPASNKKKKEKKNGLSKVGTSEVCENSDIRQFYLTEKMFTFSWSGHNPGLLLSQSCFYRGGPVCSNSERPQKRNTLQPCHASCKDNRGLCATAVLPRARPLRAAK